jgi:hypothetical protein
MIIIMAKDFDHDRGGNALCKRYYADNQSQLAVFNRDCFTNLKDNRVTFLGHADSERFGGNTAVEFVEKLTNPAWGATLPKTVTDIDLIGCIRRHFTLPVGDNSDCRLDGIKYLGIYFSKGVRNARNLDYNATSGVIYAIKKGRSNTSSISSKSWNK